MKQYWDQIAVTVMTSFRIFCCICALFLLSRPGAQAQADGVADRGEAVSSLDIKIEIRVLDFLRDPAHRDKVAVIYDRGNAESLRQAEFTLRTLQEFAALSRSHFLPLLLDRSALAGSDEYEALLLGPALADAEDEILAYAVAHRTLLLAAGRDCVRRAKCAVGVSSLPEVEIALNPEVVRKSGIHFADGFQLMVKEY